MVGTQGILGVAETLVKAFECWGLDRSKIQSKYYDDVYVGTFEASSFSCLSFQFENKFTKFRAISITFLNLR